jgi:uncharacterized protein YhaN
MYLRQSKVKELLEKGYTVDQIAKETGAKKSNVKLHINNIKKEVKKPELDDLTDFIIDKLEKAKAVEEFEKRVRTLENQKASLENEVKILTNKLKKQQDQKERFELAVKQGEINGKS